MAREGHNVKGNFWIDKTIPVNKLSQLLTLGVLAILSAPLTAITLATAGEPSGQAAPDQRRSEFKIPAQDLNGALLAFADKAGVQLFYDADRLSGLRTNGISGTYTAAEALKLLLANTGFTYRFTTANAVTLERATAPATSTAQKAKPVSAQEPQPEPQTPTISLPPVVVTGSHQDKLGEVKVDQATVTRSGASILDTPMTISVIPRQTVDHQDAQTLGDVVRNIAGARTTSYFGTYDWITSRGFGLDIFNNYLRNGFRFVNLVEVPKHNVARYELIKGPMSMDYGRVEPGGLLNIVTKQPQAERVGEIQVGGAQHRAYDVSFDIGGAINESSSLLYRLTGGSTQQAFHTDHVKPRQHNVAGALAFNLTPTTHIDVDTEYSYRDQIMYPGLAVPDPMNARSANRLSLKNFYGESVDKFKGELKLFSGRITQELNEDWSVNVGYSKNFTTRKPWQIILTGLDSTGLEVNREAYDYSQKYDIDTAQTELKGKFSLFGTRHRVTFLVDSVRQNGEEFPNDGLLVGPVSLYNPRRTGSEIDPTTLWEGWKFKSHDYGISVQDYVEITPWLNVLAGVRYSNYKEISPGMADQKGRSTDPTGALIIKPFPWMSLYGSYTRSSAPNVGILTGPDSFAPPSEAKQYEIGAKAEWLGGALRTAISYFHLTKTNVPTPALNLQFSEISGEVRAKGWEFEAVGQLTNRWNVMAGFAIVDATITKDNTPTNVGNKLPGSPRTSGSLWSTYDLSGFAEGWTIGGGIFYTGRKHVAEDNLVKLPSHTIADTMVSYRFKSLLPGARIQVNLRNIFDKRHYESGQSNDNGFTALFPGLPRTLSASLTIPF